MTRGLPPVEVTLPTFLKAAQLPLGSLASTWQGQPAVAGPGG